MFSGLLVFVFVFVLVGVAMHVGLYGKPGIFVWSLEKESGSYALSRTTLEVDSVAATESSVSSAVEEKKVEEKPESPPKPEPEPEVPVAKEDPGKFVLYNGKDLGEWEKTQFGGEGDVFVNEDGNLEFGFGAVITG